jgi:hypothetical protein
VEVMRSCNHPGRRPGSADNQRRKACVPEGGDLGTGLGKTENVVDEDQHVLAFFITEIFGAGQRGQGHAGTGSRGLGHLTVDQGRFGQNAGVLHFVIEVVAFTGTLPHAGKHGDTAVLHGDVVNHFHHDNGFANTGAAEHAHLTAAGKRHQQVDDLDAGFKHVDFGGPAR